MTFDEITGHAAVKQQLQNLLKSDKLSHAYIFCGPEGVGKLDVAKAWADMITGGSFADVKLITNDEYADSVKKTTKSQALSVETIRAAGNDMYLKPYMADKRVFIIPDGDTMTIPAQNALLKVFEEPPEYCVIIIVANNYEALLQTIRSRAIPVRFNSLAEAEVREHLEKNGLAPSPIVIALANGSSKKAVQLAQNKESLDTINNLFRILPAFFDGKMGAIYDLIGFLQKNKADSDLIFDALILFFEQSLLQLCGKSVTIPLGAVDSSKCAQYITITESCRKALKSNVNYNMAVSELVLNLRRI